MPVPTNRDSLKFPELQQGEEFLFYDRSVTHFHNDEKLEWEKRTPGFIALKIGANSMELVIYSLVSLSVLLRIPITSQMEARTFGKAAEGVLCHVFENSDNGGDIRKTLGIRLRGPVTAARFLSILERLKNKQ